MDELAVLSQQLLLAYLNGDEEVYARIDHLTDEQKNHLLVIYMGSLAEWLAHISGGPAGAAMAVEMTIADLRAGAL